MKIFSIYIVIPTLLILSLPAAGALVAGISPERFLDFPPVPVMVRHAPFSLPVFIFMAGCIVAFIYPFIKKAITFRTLTPDTVPSHGFPWWGYVCLAGFFVFWILAWTRFSWFAPFQAHTFFPLWLCLILLINALNFQKTGHCPIKDESLDFIVLFFASALFWWIFEYLNRFTSNWHYSGSQYPALKYFILATLSFSTVLPAVKSTGSWLSGFDLFREAFCDMKGFPIIESSKFAVSIIGCGSLSLFLTPVFPDMLFWCIWISPFLVFLGFQILSGQKHIFSDVKNADYTIVAVYACAALICGFLWEMLNMFSLARWQYSIPFVDRFHIFEMPLEGYAGYLPFGLECALIIDIIKRHKT